MKRILLISLFLIPNLGFAFEIVDQGETTVNIQVGDVEKVIGNLEFEVVRTKAVGLLKCDNHPDDPMCESEGFYFEREAYDYLKNLELGVQYRFFAPTEIPEYVWDEAETAELVTGILIVFKSDVNSAVVETAVQALAESYF